MSRPRRLTTVAELRADTAAARARGERVALVPTMGALHEGHLALVELAARHAERVVVSVFVNPTQFERADDLATYPRDLDGDERALAGLGPAAPAVVFAPEVAEIYPREPLTTVSVRGLTERLCGASRPGHFDGVATVVTKLLNLVQPDVAVFGRKDHQQLQVVRRLVADLDLAVRIVGAPTVREPDGLARSSRNRRLGAGDRARARTVPAALVAAVLTARSQRVRTGAHDAAAIRAAALAVLGAGEVGGHTPALELDYLEVLTAEELTEPVGTVPQQVPLVAAVAVRIGAVRLIDNVVIGDIDDEQRLLAVAAPQHRGGPG